MTNRIRRAARAVQWQNAGPLLLCALALAYMAAQMVRGLVNGTFP